jgi:hypothetical protein
MVAAAIANPGNGLLRSYERSMSRRPLQTKMATCLVGFSLGDLVAQSVTWAREPVLPDVPRRKYRHAIHGSRIARMGLFGAFVAAPQMHAFFTWLDRVWSSDMRSPHPALHVKLRCRGHVVPGIPLCTEMLMFASCPNSLHG